MTEPERKAAEAREAEVQDYEDARAWLLHGVSKGWCSDSVCATHDGLPLTEDEDEEEYEEEGGDPCVPAVRLW